MADPGSGFTLTWHDPEDAENVAMVLIEAGTKGARVTDHGFYDDGRSLMEQVDAWRARQREDAGELPAESKVVDLMAALEQSVLDARAARGRHGR